MLLERIQGFISERPIPTEENRFEELASLALAALGTAPGSDRSAGSAGSTGSTTPNGTTPSRRWSEETPALPERDLVEHSPLETLAEQTAFEIAALAGLPTPPILEMAFSETAIKRQADRLAERFGGESSKSAIVNGRLDSLAARSWLGARQRDRRAALLLASREGLERLIGTLERQDLRFQLAPESRVVILGEGEPTPIDPATRETIHTRLGTSSPAILSQWSWPGVPTPLYAEASPSGFPISVRPPHWVRVRALDPQSLTGLESGAVGRLAVADLSILGRPFYLRTRTLGLVDGDRVTVTGAIEEPA